MGAQRRVLGGGITGPRSEPGGQNTPRAGRAIAAYGVYGADQHFAQQPDFLPDQTADASDSIAVTDSATVSTALTRTAADSVSVGDVATRAGSFARTAQDTVLTAPPVRSDSFTDTTGTTLQAHAGESLTWANHPASAGNAVITAAGRARHATASQIALVAAGSPMTDSEYDVEADFVAVTNTTTVFTGIVGRLDAAANTMYLARYNGSTGQWQLLRGVAGTFTTLASVNQALTVGQSYRVKLQLGAAAKNVFVDGVEIISSADNTITAAGSAGVRLFDSTVASDASSVQVDNFTVTPAAAPAGISDRATAIPSMGRAAADTVNVADVATRSAARARTTTDTLSVADAATRQGAGARTATETVTVTATDAAARASARVRAASEAVPVVDTATRQRAGARAATDTVSTGDAAARGTTTRTRAAGDQVAVSDSTGRAPDIRAAADTIAISDTATRAGARLRAGADTVAVVDAVSRTSPRAGAAGDTVTLADTAVRYNAGARGAADTVDVTDLAAGIVGGTVAYGPGEPGHLGHPTAGRVATGGGRLALAGAGRIAR